MLCLLLLGQVLLFDSSKAFLSKKSFALHSIINDRDLQVKQIGRRTPKLFSAVSATNEDGSKISPEANAVLPWTQTQYWALKDNLSKYLVSIPVARSAEGEQPSPTHALWSTMLRDVPELFGYDVSTVREMHQHMLQHIPKTEDELNQKWRIATPGVLPFLDQFQFEVDGGIAGEVYGLSGIADGTVIRTPPLSNLEQTVPMGYVLTDTGTIAYELGIPNGEKEYAGLTRIDRSALLKMLSVTAMSIKTPLSVDFAEGKESKLLMNIGGATAILLGGATVINLLTHHLTVNMFWV